MITIKSLSFRSLASAVLTALFMVSCGTTESQYYGGAQQTRKHNTPQFWPLNFPPSSFAESLSAGITIKKGSQSRNSPDLKTAIESLKTGEWISLVAGRYSIPVNVTVPAGIQELVVEGVGKETIIGFNGKGVEDENAAKIISHVPVTFRFASLYRPRVKSESARARVWLEEVFVSESFGQEGTARFDYRGGLLTMLGGQYTELSANDIYRRKPKYYVSGSNVQVRGTAIYSPGNLTKSAPMSVLKIFDLQASSPQVLGEFQETLNKIRSQGSTDLPPKSLGQAVLEQLRAMPEEKRVNTIAYNDPYKKFYGERVVFTDRFMRLLERMYSKGPSGESEEKSKAIRLQLSRAEEELKQKNILLALYILSAINIDSLNPEFPRHQELQTKTMQAIRKDHGCAFTVGGKSAPGLFHNVRQKMMNLYPMTLILDSEAKGCRIEVKIHQDNLSEVESDVSEQVINQTVETEEARRQRESALAAAAGDVWKDAFQRISNASDRSLKVWSNQEKYRTRTEQRASGEYLISYKGNPNVPASSLNSLPRSSAAPGASMGGGSGAPGTRQKTTITKDYFLYTSHYTDLSIDISDGGKKVIVMDHMKNRFDTKNACRSQSVDGNSFSLLAGNCIRGNASFRSSFISQTVEDAMTSYIIEKRLPIVVKSYASLYQSENPSQISEATLGAVLYGGKADSKGEASLAKVSQAVNILKPTNAEEIRTHLITAIQKAQMQ